MTVRRERKRRKERISKLIFDVRIDLFKEDFHYRIAEKELKKVQFR